MEILVGGGFGDRGRGVGSGGVYGADLRKMQHAVGFDPVGRYAKMRRFYGANGFDAEEHWVARRIEMIGR